MTVEHRVSRRSFVSAGITAASVAATTTQITKAAENPKPSAPGFAQPLAQEFVTVYKRHNTRTYVEGCGLILLPDNSTLAVVPVVPRGGVPKKGKTEINFIRSDNKGKTWTQISQLPFYSAVPFLHDGKLYSFLFSMGTKFRNDDVYMAKSEDGGATWSEPVIIFKGHFWTCHTNMVIQDNRLYWAIDDLQLPDHSRARSPRAIVGDLSADLMNPASWRMSNFVPFPGIPELLKKDDYSAKKLGIWDMPDHWLEANVVEVGGKIRLLATVKSQSQMITNLCAVCDIQDDGEDLQMTFSQYHPMAGGHLKFAIVWDQPSRMFWATANFAVDCQESQDWFSQARKSGHYNGTGGNDRRFLMLLYSVDALNWFQAGCVAQANDLHQSFMYGKPVIDGEDMLVISRSAVNAPDQHDADQATFHRVNNFRSLALNLF